MKTVRIGTCSWKYDSWKGIIYSEKEQINYLQEYAKHFDTVEIDQWFWSLFSPAKIVLPQKKVVAEYKNSVPKNFRFTVKIPNSITLTHFYTKEKGSSLKKNPYFLSNELFDEFLDSIQEILNQIGCLMFQFEYLNKEKMSSQNNFFEQFNKFYQNISNKNLPIGIEIRNPNYINKNYFEFLNKLGVIPVFLQGYYMPPIFEIYEKYKPLLRGLVVIRLHGEDRQVIEKISSGNWNKIYIDRSTELKQTANLIKELSSKKVEVYLNINNHFEGSAPLSIARIKKYLE